MARRRRASSISVKQPQTRDTSVIANPRLRLKPVPQSPGRTGDRRLFNPSVTTPRRRDPQSRLVAARQVRGRSRRPRANHHIAFANPRHVMICVRRNIRKQVLFSKGVGGTRTRKGKRNKWSSISCKG